MSSPWPCCRGSGVDFHACLTARADELCELADAVLCADGPVRDLAGLSLAAEHRRGHGALYDAVNHGRIDIGRLRRSLAGLALPRAADGRLVLAADVSNWLRPGAATSPERLFCHVYGRGKGQAQMIPGWPYSVIAALEPGRTSWTAVLDAVRLGPDDDETEVTAAQVREVVTRLIEAGHWREGDLPVLVVFDAGYDVTRLAWLLADLPVELLGRLRCDRVMRLPAPPRQPGTKGRPRKHGRELALSGPGGLPGPADHHQHGDLPVRHRRGRRLGPGASPADPPRRLAGPRRRPAGHRRDPDPAASRSPARRPRPQAGVAVVVTHRRRARRRGPVLAGVLAPLRSRTHIQVLQAGPRVDRPEDPRPRGRGPVDLADHRLPRPAAPGPPAGRRPAPPLGTARTAGPATPARVRRGFRNIRAKAGSPPVRRNPANPARAGRQGRRTATRRPATTWEKQPRGNSRSRPGANAQVKRQAK